MLIGFLPSQYVLFAGAIFYLGGLIFALFDPLNAQSNLYEGIFTGKIVTLIQVPDVVTYNYLLNQFVYFLGYNAFQIFLNNLFFSLICILTGISIFQ